IPVLVGGAVMPEPTELPESLKALAFRNAAEVDAGRDFNQHTERLIRSMDFILAKKGKGAQQQPAAAAAPVAPPPAQAFAGQAAAAAKPRSRMPLIAAAAAIVLLAGGGIGTW